MLDFAPATFTRLERFRTLCWLVCLIAFGLGWLLWNQGNRLETERNSIALQNFQLDKKLREQVAFQPASFGTGTNGDRSNQQDLNTFLTVLNKAWPAYAFAVDAFLSQLEAQASTAFQVTDLSMDLEAGQLSLSLKALDFETVESMKDALQAVKLEQEGLSILTRISDQRREQQSQSFGSNFGSNFGNAPQNLTVATIELVVQDQRANLQAASQ